MSPFFIGEYYIKIWVSGSDARNFVKPCFANASKIILQDLVNGYNIYLDID